MTGQITHPSFGGVNDSFTPFVFAFLPQFLPQLNACFRIASNIKVAFDMKSKFGGDGFRHPFPCTLPPNAVLISTPVSTLIIASRNYKYFPQYSRHDV